MKYCEYLQGFTFNLVPIEALTGDDGLRAGSASSFLVSPWNKKPNMFYVNPRLAAEWWLVFHSLPVYRECCNSTQNPPLGGTTPVISIQLLSEMMPWLVRQQDFKSIGIDGIDWNHIMEFC